MHAWFGVRKSIIAAFLACKLKIAEWIKARTWMRLLSRWFETSAFNGEKRLPYVCSSRKEKMNVDWESDRWDGEKSKLKLMQNRGRQSSTLLLQFSLSKFKLENYSDLPVNPWRSLRGAEKPFKIPTSRVILNCILNSKTDRARYLP
jgi:hypothetical protein